MKKVMMGTEAAALAAALARVQVVSAYPITPQTVIVEELADIIGRGDLDAKYINVESEHSAMASCIGAAATGARTFTATSSQGLALMHEVLHYASGARVPIVMANANRALAPPWNLYCDHTDALSQRDTGWIQYYCADVQDVMDAILIAYRVAEKVLLPVMVNLDAFYLTHTSELLDVPEQASVDRYLPAYRPESKLDVDDPKTFGNVCGADLYTSFKFSRHKDTLGVSRHWNEAAGRFADEFGRRHPVVRPYRTDDADLVIVAIGTAAGAIRMAADRLREEGVAAGSLRLSMVRPFPVDEVRAAVARARHVVVVDRDVSFGAEGIVAQEVKAALFGMAGDIHLHGFVAGIGGNDITSDSVVELARQALAGSGAAVQAGNSYWGEVLA
ncbi:pyruvate ferredoxin oxidoreductase subunit alpha [Desulfosarcina alkanivorans]|uniref:Pyruvate ferredoxin oxidoreductase subunit alpha n=1 Tax=Desulfosarcina alkanivorans TaxID=571177 RepID=A0A5K7YJM3_9BACT|nr:transketolase C-terminal domain-containing protein [Desulfosarcina alkanivorans]BBO69068.1 pyruvate ferredoxin oxidoreductase subunit alpha [Desulfosarcina alkanivorans]